MHGRSCLLTLPHGWMGRKEQQTEYSSLLEPCRPVTTEFRNYVIRSNPIQSPLACGLKIATPPHFHCLATVWLFWEPVWCLADAPPTPKPPSIADEPVSIATIRPPWTSSNPPLPRPYQRLPHSPIPLTRG